MKKLDIVIPHLNNEDFITGLKSLRRNTPEGVINKVILIDQCEHNHDEELKGLVDIHLKTPNLGFAKAMNTGIRLSDAPYVMCANDDIIWLNKQWWAGIEYTFERAISALCVSPASVCDPDGAGGKSFMDMNGRVGKADYTKDAMSAFPYQEDYSDELYAKLLEMKGQGWIDGICMWGPVFKREMLDKLPGTIPGKGWFDERFRYGGGEDYNMNRAAYKSGMRCLGTSHSIVWHHWHMTKGPTGSIGAHYDDNFQKLNGVWEDGQLLDKADVYGQHGRKDIPQIVIRED